MGIIKAAVWHVTGMVLVEPNHCHVLVQRDETAVIA